MQFEKYKAQFAFLREHVISTTEQLAAYITVAEERLAALTKQRTILNVQKKKRMPIYTAFADAEVLKPVKALYDEGMTGIEDEFSRYMDTVAVLEKAGISNEQLAKEKAQMYEKVSEVNKDIRRKQERS